MRVISFVGQQVNLLAWLLHGPRSVFIAMSDSDCPDSCIRSTSRESQLPVGRKVHPMHPAPSSRQSMWRQLCSSQLHKRALWMSAYPPSNIDNTWLIALCSYIRGHPHRIRLFDVAIESFSDCGEVLSRISGSLRRKGRQCRHSTQLRLNCHIWIHIKPHQSRDDASIDQGFVSIHLYSQAKQAKFMLKMWSDLKSCFWQIAAVAPQCLEQLSKLLLAVCKNPTVPGFNHFLFESVAALINNSVADAKTVETLESMLFPAFQTVLTEDVQVSS